jgi:hypothetical protein
MHLATTGNKNLSHFLLDRLVQIVMLVRITNNSPNDIACHTYYSNFFVQNKIFKKHTSRLATEVGMSPALDADKNDSFMVTIFVKVKDSAKHMKSKKSKIKKKSNSQLNSKV